jgi:hypothetical protein
MKQKPFSDQQKAWPGWDQIDWTSNKTVFISGRENPRVRPLKGWAFPKLKSFVIRGCLPIFGKIINQVMKAELNGKHTFHIIWKWRFYRSSDRFLIPEVSGTSRGEPFIGRGCSNVLTTITNCWRQEGTTKDPHGSVIGSDKHTIIWRCYFVEPIELSLLLSSEASIYQSIT